MELKREHFFNDDDLNIDSVAQFIQMNPTRTKEVLEFISHEMRNEVEFRDKLDELKHNYHKQKKKLYEEY
jgi:hypothetical protein